MAKKSAQERYYEQKLKDRKDYERQAKADAARRAREEKAQSRQSKEPGTYGVRGL